MSERLADDLIVGTARIGEEIGRTRRQTQHLIDTGEIPAFKLGGEVGLSTLDAAQAFRAAGAGCAGFEPCGGVADAADLASPCAGLPSRPRAGCQHDGAEQ